jgi:hypothetical protein
MNIFTQFIKRNSHENRKHEIVQDLIRREAEITRDIFGKVPNGTRREFFCLDKNTWIWYEEWADRSGVQNKITTRYIVRPKEIIKSQNGGAYHRLSFEEAKNFNRATNSYLEKVTLGLYAEKQRA